LAVPENENIKRRLDDMNRADKRVFEFLVSVLVNNERETLLVRLPPDDKRNPTYAVVNETFREPMKCPEIEGIIESLKRERAVSAVPEPSFPITVRAAFQQDFEEPKLYHDPEELRTFLGSYGINYAALAGEGVPHG
jgi:hypothetical protein